jgi:probable F420-dependent oxidoreductase
VNLGRLGVWRRRQDGPGVVGELESLGYGSVWIGSSPSVEEARPWLEAAGSIVVATGILNVWQHEPADVVAAHAEVTRDFPGRFLLGIGVGHPEATSDYTRPLTAMRRFFDGLEGVPRDELVAAALGPKMLDLAAERSLGTHPYFTTPEHTGFARERIGPGKLVAPELAVVVEEDAARAREVARRYAATYLGLTNYTSNLLRFGFTEADIADGGSDRLIDAVIPHGSAESVAEAVAAHFEAGADHVCVQPLGQPPDSVEHYRALARVLL